MGRGKIALDKKSLEELYLKKGLSPYKIADLLNCSFSTVTNRLNEYKIPLKSNSVARQRYAKKDFLGSSRVRAYMIGFRIGDLNVYQTNPGSEVIIVRCHTTTTDQLDVIDELFGKYGKVTISQHADGSYHINCFLNKSFSFLLAKELDYSEIITTEDFYSFFAGYLDAEGYIGLGQGRARLKIDSYDKDILFWISKKLNSHKIRNIFRVISVCEDKRNFGKELCRLNVNYAQDLENLFCKIKKYSLHKKRLKQIQLAQDNIRERKNGIKQG